MDLPLSGDPEPFGTQVDEAFAVADTLGGLGIDLSEAEFAALLHACQFPGAAWQRTAALLRRIGRELTVLNAVRESGA